MRKTVPVTIEGYTYEISQLGAAEGRVLVLRFAKVLGRFIPLLVDAAKSAGQQDATAAKATLQIFEDVGAAINEVDPTELEPLWDAFARHAYVRGKDGKSRELLSEIFDEHFAGEYFAMVRFFVEAAKLNFGDFFARALVQASAADASGATS